MYQTLWDTPKPMLRGKHSAKKTKKMEKNLKISRKGIKYMRRRNKNIKIENSTN